MTNAWSIKFTHTAHMCGGPKQGSRTKRMGQKESVEGDPLALVGGTLGPPVQGKLQGAGHFKSPSRVAELQGQIKNLSEEQKRALQEQIARKES